jgi:hypothetical protein
MNNVPTVSSARGVFDIFMPGLFLFLNLGLVVYLLPFVDSDTRAFFGAVVQDEALLLVLTIGCGYLIGVLLRLRQTQYPDRWSAWWRRTFSGYTRGKSEDVNLWAEEEFPYIGWIGKVCKQYLSPEAQRFYDATWAPRKQVGQNRQFFNFCKVMINSVDARSADEINAAEALSRYIAAMFFAVAIAFILILITAIWLWSAGQAMMGLLVLLLVYLLALIVILSYFRFVRIREVEIVFAASLKNRSIFEEELVATIASSSSKTD